MTTRFIAAIAVSAVMLGAGAASAADLPARMVTKAPVYTKAPPIEVFSWTGFYIGANLGFGSAHASSDIMGNDTSQNTTGVVGGGQVGYNWQAPGSPWVFGVELDAQGTSQDRTWTGAIGGGGGLVTQETSLPWFMTLRGHVGYAFAPMWMVYVTGGGAWGEVKSVVTAPVVGSTSWDQTRGGWALGAGIEGWFNRQWSWKAEYLHVDLGSGNTVLFGVAPANIGLTNDIGRVGVNFHLL
jgi:outer membrane immunogenic protein